MLGTETATASPQSSTTVTTGATDAGNGASGDSSGSQQSTATGATGDQTPAKAEPTGLDLLGVKAKSKKTTAAPNVPPPAPTFTPNLKFKVKDKELEFEDWAKGVVKDAETEKKIREFHEKAYGLDEVKQSRQAVQNELGQAKEKMAKTDLALTTLGNYVQAGDFDSFFESLQIPKNKIVEYAVQLIQREQNPELKQRWEESRRSTQAIDYYKTENQRLMEGQQQLAVQQRTFELSTTLSRPDVVAVAQAFETGIGTPGAFKEYVVQIGQAYAARGQDISVEQAVSEAVRNLKAVNPSLGQAATPATSPSGPGVVAPNTKPIIPDTRGRGTSPVQSTIKSLDDLKRKAKELNSAY